MQQTLQQKPPIIVFEGIDGTGKTAQTDLLCDHLQATGKKFLKAGPYNSTTVGKEVRKLNTGSEPIPPLTRVGLVLAAQLDCGQAIQNSSEFRGAAAVMDRGWMSSLVYQGLAPEDESATKLLLAGACAHVQCFAAPTIVFFLSMPPADAHARLQQARRNEHFKARGVEWAAKLQDSYLAMIEAGWFGVASYRETATRRMLASCLAGIDFTTRMKLRELVLGTKFITLNAARRPEEVHAEVLRHIEGLNFGHAEPAATAGASVAGSNEARIDAGTTAAHQHAGAGL